MKKIFIDGSSGTTGLRIFDRLTERKDIELITLSDEQRKDPIARKKSINESDITFLCLPDDAAKESVSFLENDKTVIIDTSTAHRTNSDWLYGFKEVINDFDSKIKTAKKIAVPGCHASGFIALVKPLIDNKIIDSKTLLTCTSITGYSGGGKKMIEEYENENSSILLKSPRQYALGQTHKHLKEMSIISGLDNPPAFMPIVAPFYSGMEVSVPLFKSQLLNGKSRQDIIDLYKKIYNSNIVYYSEDNENGFISSNYLSTKDSMAIQVFGNDDRILLVARYDNLGKGASGAAIQCLNYVLNTFEETGLNL